MKLGGAVTAVKARTHVVCSGWNGKNLWLGMRASDAHSNMTLPYICIKTVDCGLVSWLGSRTDMLANDRQENTV
jgi:hypothetical protein